MSTIGPIFPAHIAVSQAEARLVAELRRLRRRSLAGRPPRARAIIIGVNAPSHCSNHVWSRAFPDLVRTFVGVNL
jgi:hypothetical protein